MFKLASDKYTTLQDHEINQGIYQDHEILTTFCGAFQDQIFSNEYFKSKKSHIIPLTVSHIIALYPTTLTLYKTTYIADMLHLTTRSNFRVRLLLVCHIL